MVHHLFPGVCHCHYPALAEIVKRTAKEFGVPYKVYPTVRPGSTRRQRSPRARLLPQPQRPRLSPLTDPHAPPPPQFMEALKAHFRQLRVVGLSAVPSLSTIG